MNRRVTAGECAVLAVAFAADDGDGDDDDDDDNDRLGGDGLEEEDWPTKLLDVDLRDGFKGDLEGALEISSKCAAAAVLVPASGSALESSALSSSFRMLRAVEGPAVGTDAAEVSMVGGVHISTAMSFPSADRIASTTSSILASLLVVLLVLDGCSVT